MVYIDSDGVISDFESWVFSHDASVMNSVIGVDTLMVNNYKEVFLNVDKCKNADKYIDCLISNKNCFVLTALPNTKRLKKEFPNIEDIELRVEVMRENKFKWFERIGVPREKVIIVNSSKEKLKYCTSCVDTLFDDRPLNVERWKEQGGIGILVK